MVGKGGRQGGSSDENESTVKISHAQASLVIFVAIAWAALLPALALSADDASGRKKEIERIRREMREKKREIKRADKKERSVLAELENLDKAIQTGRDELISSRKRLQEAEKDLREVEKNNAEFSTRLSGLKSLYMMRIRALYKTGRAGYAEAVLSSKSFSSAVRRAKYLGIIIERDHAIIEDYRGEIERLSEREEQLQKAKGEIIRQRQIVAFKKTELEDARRKKAGLLSETRKKKELYEQSLHELEESSASIWAMIKKAEKEKKASKAAVSPRQGTASPAASSNRFPWPVEGRVVSFYGMQRHPQFGTMVFKRGIEIESRPGEKVRVVQDGQVLYANWYKGYGRLAIIEHGAGVYTMYGHLSSLDVSEGGKVLKGQALGTVGDTGGTKDTKLYFEIRHSGEARDPLLWLAKR